jgi:hypothetical protein
MKKIYLLFLTIISVVYGASAQNTCANAVAIPALPFNSGALTTCGSGDEYAAGTLYDDDYGDGEDYVFSYTVTNAPQNVLISITGTDSWAIASVHSACPPTTANAIGAAVTGSSDEASSIITFSTNGTYYIIVDTWPSPDCTPFTLSLTVASPPPANDICSGAVVIPAAGPFPYLTGATSNVSATDTNDPLSSCQSNSHKGVWYSFTPAATGVYKISTCETVAPLSTIADNVLALFTSTGGCAGPFTGIDCNDDFCGTQASTTATLTAGTTYYILASGYNGASGNVQLHISIPVLPACTNNISPANGATDVAYAAGATISWNAVSGATEYEIMFSDDAGANYFSLGTTPGTSDNIIGMEPLTTYYFYIIPIIDGESAVGCESNATSFTTGAVPANDNPCNAVTIGITPILSTTIGSTQSLPPSLCTGATSSDANDMWYQFTATTNGDAVVVLNNIGSADLVLQAFSGACGSLTSVSCVDESTGDETLPLSGLVAGQTYFVRVYGYDGDEGVFEISVSGAALPIAIEYFRGTKQNSRNVLDWRVSCYGSPSVTLTLERSSDGRHFEGISSATETAARCQQPFSYSDLSPLAGINYYRLKSIDIDGTISYSNVVALLNKDKGFEIVSLAPNPVKDEAILSVTSAERAVMEIVVSDLNGKQISKQRLSLIAGNNQVPLNLRNVAAGTYQVTGLTADGQVRSLRFVKQ